MPGHICYVMNIKVKINIKKNVSSSTEQNNFNPFIRDWVCADETFLYKHVHSRLP